MRTTQYQYPSYVLPESSPDSGFFSGSEAEYAMLAPVVRAWQQIITEHLAYAKIMQHNK